MWWFRRTRRSLLAGLPLLALIVGACGFEPLYAERNQQGMAIASELAAIDVARIDDPLGVELRNQILSNLAPISADTPPRYRLAIQLNRNKIPLITEENSQISRFDLVLTASYELVATDTGTVLASGSVSSATSYNIVESADFASLVAEQSAGKQAAREASREIVTRISLYFDRAAS